MIWRRAGRAGGPGRRRQIEGEAVAAGRDAYAACEIELDSTDDDRKTAAERIGPAGKEQAQGPGEAESLLKHGYFREDMIDQVRRGLDHPSCAAGETVSTAFAGEDHDVLVAAAVAPHAHKAVFEPPAAKLIRELAPYEGGRVPAWRCPASTSTESWKLHSSKARCCGCESGAQIDCSLSFHPVLLKTASSS